MSFVSRLWMFLIPAGPTKQLIQELLKTLVDWTRRMSPAPESTSASSTATAWHPLSRGAPA